MVTPTSLARAAVFCAAFGYPAAAVAQDVPEFRIEASGRARIETIAGQYRPGTPSSETFVSFRTNLVAEVDAGPIRVGGELLDARGYTSEPRSSATFKERDALEPVQAYVALDLQGVAGKDAALAVTAGRFTMDFGSSRLVGRTDFPDVPPSYAGVNLDWRNKAKDRFLAFWTRPFSLLPNEPVEAEHNLVQLDRVEGNQTFYGAAFAKAAIVPGISGELYAFRLAEHDVPGHATRDRRLVTVGTRFRRAPGAGKMDFEIEAVAQWGEARASAGAADVRDLPVGAAFAHAEAGWTLAGGWAPRVSAMFDYASGDHSDPDHYGRFDTLFGSRRSDFGPTALYGPINRANLVSPGVRIEAKPGKQVDAFIAVRGLWLDSATDSFASTGVRDRTGASGRHAGTQVELRGRYWLVPKTLRLEAGAAYLAKGRFLREAPNAPVNGNTRYGYAEIAVQL